MAENTPQPEEPPATAPETAPAEPQSGFYNADEPEQIQPSGPAEITWTASEFMAHEKSASWYTGLAAVAAMGCIVIYLITKDFLSVAVIVVGALVFGYYASHRPRELGYRLDQRGISIGPKIYGYDEFRNFSVVPEGAFSSIVFMPLKRFSLPISIYYAPEDEEKIVTLLSNQLPFEPPRRDAVESLMRRIRF